MLIASHEASPSRFTVCFDQQLQPAIKFIDPSVLSLVYRP